MPETYPDKLEDVMQYVKLRLDVKGVRLQIRDKDDLRGAIEWLDANRTGGGKKGKGESRMSVDFIDTLMERGNPSRYLQKTIGSFGKVFTMGRGGSEKPVTTITGNKRTDEKVRAIEKEKRDVFETRTKGQYAIKSVLKRKKGSPIIVYRDVRTGRFIGKKNIQ
jgi:hypothetical protein